MQAQSRSPWFFEPDADALALCDHLTGEALQLLDHMERSGGQSVQG